MISKSSLPTFADGRRKMTSELRVSYDRQQRRATIEFVGDASVWPRIRRVCQDKSDQCEISGPASMQLPWWTFLASRAELEFLGNRFGFKIVARAGAEQKLAEAFDVTRQ